MIRDILLVNKAAPIWFTEDKEYLMTYLFLLSHCDKNLIISRVSLTEMMELDINHIELMIKNEHIKKSRSDYVFGVFEKSKKYLYVNTVSPITNEKIIVDEKVSAYNRRRIKKRDIIDNSILLRTYFDNPEQIVGVRNVIDIWQCFKAVKTGFVSRELTKKEIGQFSHLVRMFGVINAAKLVILYLNDDGNNIGALLNVKDKYAEKFVNDKTEIEDEEGFI